MRRPVRRDGADLLVDVRLTPRGGRDAIEGPVPLADGSVALEARVRAVPEDGKANAALTALLAARLGVARSTVSIASGASQRLKTLRIADADAEIEAVLANLLGSPADPA